MLNVLILYYSRTGSTAAMADAVALGVERVAGVAAVLRTVPPVSALSEATAAAVPDQGAPYATLADLQSCAGLVVGSPTRFGNMAAPLKHFIDSTGGLWQGGDLIDKPFGCFTSTGSMHGGQESTLLSMMLPFVHHGMVYMGVPYSEADLLSTTTGGTPYGASHVSGPGHEHRLSAEEGRIAQALGQRIATFAQQRAEAR